MKAVVYDRYGSPDVLELREVPKPAPKANEMLIKVHATTVTSADWRARTLSVPKGFGLMARLFFGIAKPRQPILGTELAGEIESVGRAVRTFKVGDQVLAFTGARMGCHAEYRCIAETAQVALKPANLTYQEAASISFGAWRPSPSSGAERSRRATRCSSMGLRAEWGSLQSSSPSISERR